MITAITGQYASCSGRPEAWQLAKRHLGDPLGKNEVERRRSVNWLNVRQMLRDQTEAKRRSQGDTTLMKLCCVQLFNAGVLDYVLLILASQRGKLGRA